MLAKMLFIVVAVPAWARINVLDADNSFKEGAMVDGMDVDNGVHNIGNMAGCW